MTIHSQALAYLIWRHAEPRAWDCTVSEIAEAIGSHPIAVGRVCGAKGWSNRLRTSEMDRFAHLCHVRWAA
ncbi:hypothetical protein JMM63_21960 [Rhodovulum sulfidophilum]|uniref:hypothetical protein n=1 Tax=Rhodovulum sulfidophilum TaxID=35806 RepID=UPI0019224F3E|nr:hypothetical protein [Rhodovulum sulfidophilum]MBL3563342.1 hypothetical protein [Rhodovulum sulfidophilum]MBL3598171.1 hypothetical protein [Rhodovulum sulfidophilum]